MKENRLVSVIMPAYNCQSFITGAIQSVIQQTYTNWELLIVDDASTDATRKCIKEHSISEPRIRSFFNSKNRGTDYSRNKAIKAAKGAFIAFLDADDLWLPNKLEKQLQVLNKENVAACFSSYELIDETGNRCKKKVKALPVLSYNRLLKANYVGNLTGIYNAELLGKIYCPPLKKRQDWALWLKVIEEGGPMEGISDVLAYYRVRKDSISGNKIEMLKYNYRVYRLLGFSVFGALCRMLLFLKEQFCVKNRNITIIE
ncbi:glycosyltransferase family 2 protein [Christiangramia aquimixticola]|uniref:glycosyltransferase family 2 protein n=1 Tax=Christiangramia aquimixticola TaxID=1697558 RepID=UPI003AA98E73